MTNLLPQEYKKARTNERYVRILSVGLFALALAVFAGAVALVPTYIYLNVQINSVEAQKMVAQNALGVYRDEPSALRISDIAEDVDLLSREEQNVSVLEYIRVISTSRTPGISLGEIIYHGEQNTIRLSGSADTRSALIAFTQELESTSVFEKVELPVGTLVRDADVTFGIQITLYDEE